MRARWLVPGALVAIALACTGTLDTADQVHDLRLLALRAEPPEQVLAVAFLPDGGVVGAPGGDRADGGGVVGSPVPHVPAIAPVTITGLLADPAGQGREVHYRFSTCAQVDSTTHQCSDASPGYQVLGEGTLVPTELGGEAVLTFTPDYGMLAAVQQRDPYHGFGGLWVDVQLELSAGDESVVGIKRVVFTTSLSAPLPPPNHNPEIQTLLFDGEPWDAGDQVQFQLSFRARRPGLLGQGGEATDGGSNTVTPVVDPSLFEEYDRPTFDGGSVHFKEAWRYNFFTTVGTFTPASTGGASNFAPDSDAGANPSTWQPIRGQAAGPTTIWVVVRDGRGGESWVVRQAQAPALPELGPGRGP